MVGPALAITFAAVAVAGSSRGAGQPVQAQTTVASSAPWHSTTASAAHTCGIRGNEALWCWGFNSCMIG